MAWLRRGMMSGVMLAVAATTAPSAQPERFLFDFRNETEFTAADTDSWWEVSDTVRRVGMSKAAFVLQETQVYQRAVMFAVLNPQPNGAAFAGMKANISEADLSGSSGIELAARAQGLHHWKVVLTHPADHIYVDPSGDSLPYEQVFHLNGTEFQVVRLPFVEFEAYYRGKKVEEAPPLDTNKIATFGLQTFGGVFQAEKQAGAGSLEIDYIGLY